MCVELNDIQDKLKKKKKEQYISSNKEGRERYTDKYTFICIDYLEDTRNTVNNGWRSRKER